MRPKHCSIEYGIYFVTTKCAKNEKSFIRPDACTTYCDLLKKKQKEFDVVIYSYVIMPDHVHLLLQLSRQCTLSKFMNHVNGASSRMINQVNDMLGIPLWQGGFYDVGIRTAREFAVKVNYIHDNPVRKRLVAKAEEYRFSSAKRYVEYFDSAFIDPSRFDDIGIMGIMEAFKTFMP